MKEFFKAQLENLFTAGIRQLEFIPTKDQVAQLVTELCIISEKKFNYIPLEIQQAEIRKQIIEDPDFNGLNTRVLFKWLSRIAEKYWKERGKQEEIPWVQAPPEVAEKYLKQWQEALDKIETRTTHGETTGNRLRESLDGLSKRPE